VADVVERVDVRVTESGDGFGLALEADAQLLVACEIAGQNLDGHGAVEANVTGPPHLAHAAGTGGRNDLVRPEAGTRIDLHDVEG
jgi:hypothetical protein